MNGQFTKRSIASLCAQVSSGGTPFRDNERYWANGTIPWFKTGELKDRWLYDSEEKITQEGLDSSSAKLFPASTVLMAMYGDGKTITSLGVLRNPATTNQACCAMIVDPAQCDYRFLFYKLMSVRSALLKLVVAGAQRNLSAGIIKSFEIEVPKVPLQTAIADILSAYDDLIENNRRRIGLLEEAARMLYREWFVHFRFAGHEHVKIIDGLPEGWERRSVGDVAQLAYGKALKEETRVEGPFPVYGSSGIVGTHQAALVAGPAIVVGRKGNVGSVFWSTTDFWPIDTAYFIPKDQSDFWLYLALPHVGFQNTDGGVPGLNRDFAYSRKIIKPIDRLRGLFNESVEPMFAQQETLLNYNRKLSQARDLLLPRLLNGEIAV